MSSEGDYLNGIVCVSRNGVIGVEGKLPWKLPEDLKLFKRLTKNSEVIMGRKTFESLPRPLKNRTNIVLSTKASTGGLTQYDENTYIRSVASVDEAMRGLLNPDGAFVIGGASVYQQFEGHINRWVVSVVDSDFDGDTFFDYKKLKNDFLVKDVLDFDGFSTFFLHRRTNAEGLIEFSEKDERLFSR